MGLTRIPYSATDRFQPIVLDQLADAPFLRDFQQWPSSRQGLEEALKARSFDPDTRAVLCAVLEEQYQGIDMGDAVRANIDALREDRTCTVTTGHQLCLFAGPLYVPFKILNTVRVARMLDTRQQRVVPLFWMATEDHDLAEVDHAYVNGQKVQWTASAQGAVGRMSLAGIEAVLEQVMPLIGNGLHAEELVRTLRACYSPAHTLAHATRLFLHALFGRFGVVVIDGDDARLKQRFAPLMQEEVLNQVTARTVRYANDKLAEHYPAQAHVRDLNLFYLRADARSRIEAQGDRYQVLDGGPSFSMDELLAELTAHPERFSPNVLMRPLYQETVLPNIAYIGGGGELAYWLQLCWLFQGLRVPMPVLLLRTSAALLRNKDLERWTALGLSVEDLFTPVDQLHARIAKEQASFDTAVGAERATLDRLYNELAARAKAADPTLEGAVKGEHQRSVKGLEGIEQKLVRAAKREQEQVTQRMDKVLNTLFPGGGLQERRENFMPFFAQRGPAFFDELLAQLDPLAKEFSVISDQ